MESGAKGCKARFKTTRRHRAAHHGASDLTASNVRCIILQLADGALGAATAQPVAGAFATENSWLAQATTPCTGNVLLHWPMHCPGTADQLQSARAWPAHE
eukprot:scaffold134201_cov28-Tisochrysis_lutea.AAC.3